MVFLPLHPITLLPGLSSSHPQVLGCPFLLTSWRPRCTQTLSHASVPWQQGRGARGTGVLKEPQQRQRKCPSNHHELPNSSSWGYPFQCPACFPCKGHGDLPLPTPGAPASPAHFLLPIRESNGLLLGLHRQTRLQPTTFPGRPRRRYAAQQDYCLTEQQPGE